uniref:Uncharacterized protein n=1 Tax=viral metagenome TaxID=1070528 RepID=A0A6C0B8H2_9ZZZZ
MGDYAVNNFYNYVNTLIYTDNITLIAAIRIYLIDDNIPPQYKHMNCIQDMVNVVSNRYNNEINIYNNNNNNGLTNDMIAMIVSIQDVQNMMYNGNH